MVYAQIFRRLDTDRILSLFLMACPILAGPIEDSIKAYRRGDFKTAYQLIKPEAEKGDDVAQFTLGYMYDEGKGVPQDYAEAAKWYKERQNKGIKPPSTTSV